MGPADGDGRSLPGEEDEKQPESAEENFRRLFAAIDLDPSRSSSARPPSVRVKTTAAEGGKTVTSDPEGWLAVSLTLHADEVRDGSGCVVAAADEERHSLYNQLHVIDTFGVSLSSPCVTEVSVYFSVSL